MMKSIRHGPFLVHVIDDSSACFFAAIIRLFDSEIEEAATHSGYTAIAASFGYEIDQRLSSEENDDGIYTLQTAYLAHTTTGE